MSAGGPPRRARPPEGASRSGVRGERAGTPAIVYLHGFNSAPQSVKGRLVARGAAALVPAPLVHLPRLPHRPAQAIREVCAWLDDRALGGPALALVGSSLGGYYATWLAEKYGARAIVINPAIRPWVDLRAFAGRQRNLYTGDEYDVTDEHFAEIEALRVVKITRPERYLLMVRTGDELLDWRASVAHYAGCWQYVLGGGDHGWADFGDEVDCVLRFALSGLQ